MVHQAVQGQGDALLRDLVATNEADRPHTFGGKLDLAKLRLPGVPELLFVTPGEDSVRPGPVLLTPWANLPSAVKGAKAVCGSLKQRLALLVWPRAFGNDRRDHSATLRGHTRDIREARDQSVALRCARFRVRGLAEVVVLQPQQLHPALDLFDDVLNCGHESQVVVGRRWGPKQSRSSSR